MKTSMNDDYVGSNAIRIVGQSCRAAPNWLHFWSPTTITNTTISSPILRFLVCALPENRILHLYECTCWCVCVCVYLPFHPKKMCYSLHLLFTFVFISIEHIYNIISISTQLWVDASTYSRLRLFLPLFLPTEFAHRRQSKLSTTLAHTHTHTHTHTFQ